MDAKRLIVRALDGADYETKRLHLARERAVDTFAALLSDEPTLGTDIQDMLDFFLDIAAEYGADVLFTDAQLDRLSDIVFGGAA